MQQRNGVQRGRAWLLPVMLAGLMAGILLGRAADSWRYGAAILLVSGLAALLLRGRMRMVCILTAAAGLGVWLAYDAYHPVRPEAGQYTITGVIVQDVWLGPGSRVKTVLDDVTLNGVPTGKRAYWTWYRDSPDDPPPAWFVPGETVSFAGEVYHPSGAQNPGGFNFNEYLLQRGMTFCVYDAEELAHVPAGFHLQGWLAAIRHDLTLRLMDAMGEESGAYAAAVLLGNRDYLPYEDVKAFQRLGIAHILSVSGWHVGILAMMVTLVLKLLRLPRAAGLFVRAVIFAGYAALTGGNAPVIRASLLLLLRECGKLRKHRNSSAHLVCLAAVLQLIASPVQLCSASFQLTYSAILGIMLVHPWLKRRFRPATPGLARMWDAFSAALSAQLGVLPAQLYWFASLPALTLLMNTFIMGLMSSVMTLFWVTLVLMPVPWLGTAAAAVTGRLTSLMLAGIRALSETAAIMLWTKQANWLTVLGWALLMTGLCILLKKRAQPLRRYLAGAGAVMMALSLIPLPHRGTEWIQFSVGEADAALLMDDGMVVVIDTGDEANDLHYYLLDHRLSVDLLILTHLHTDHAGGADDFVEMGIPVKRCVLPVDATLPGDVDEALLELSRTLAESGTEIVPMARGDVIELPNGTITALWPQAGTVRPAMGANDASLTLLAELRGTAMLLTGDLTGTYERYCAEPADLLKAAHHGSAESTTPGFLEAVEPQVLLLSCGDEAREESMRSRSGGIPLYSTDSQGAITVRFSDGAFSVETFLHQEKFPAE